MDAGYLGRSLLDPVLEGWRAVGKIRTSYTGYSIPIVDFMKLEDKRKEGNNEEIMNRCSDLNHVLISCNPLIEPLNDGETLCCMTKRTRRVKRHVSSMELKCM